jgi:tetratricopeptide (TPR) repeat protein
MKKVKLFLCVVLCLSMSLLVGCGGFELMKAEQQLGREQYEEAIHLYEEYLAEHPDSVRARCKLGFAYLKTGRLDPAVSEFERVLATEPGEPYATLYLGMTYLNRGELGKTIEIWQQYRDKRNPLVEKEIRRLLTLVQIAESQNQAKRALNQEKRLVTMEAPGNTIAVCYYEDRSPDHSLRAFQKGLAAMVITDLSKIKSLSVIERLRLQALLAEMKLGQTGIVDESTASRVGRLLGAETLVIGNLTLGSIQAATTLASTTTEGPKGTAAARVTEENFYTLPAMIVRQITEILDAPLSPDEAAAIQVPHTTKYEAFICFGKALDAMDVGRWEDAKNLFDMAVQIDPDFDLAREGADSCPGAGSPGLGQLGSMANADLAGVAEGAVGKAEAAQADASAASSADGGGGGGGCY